MSEHNNDIPQLWTAISHEIRTPLNVIKGMTDISENEIYDVGLMRDCLEKIKESTVHMQEVVNALVDYVAITQRNVEIQNARLDFKTMISDIAMHSYLLAKQKKCHFNMHVHDVSEEALVGDEARISQVLLAMLNIVIRYTSSEGVIDFTVLQTGISNSKVFMRFCMKSTALEFPDEIVNYLNNNSLYINPDLLSPVGTFGITDVNALYISYLMGGKITAYNKPGDYSEINLDMEFGRTQQPYSVTNTKLFEHQNILIVADKEEVCEERGKMLKDMGMSYESSTDIEDALEKIGDAEDKKKPFTICIIDWDMQSNNCVRLIREIRGIFGPELMIIVTAHAPAERIKEMKHYGADYVIDRTIFRSTLFDALISIEKGIQIEQTAEKQDKYDFSGNRVLVAEDVALNMEVITKLLSRVNVEVTCVENGLEAVTQFEKKPAGYFGAILLDINMPVMDGYAAARKIRSSGKEDSKTIPMYAMTANAFKEDVEKALENGMDGHIAKPIDVNALYRMLNQVLNKKEGYELERLRDLAETDPLTGCLNRRGFENRMNALNTDAPLAYIAIDVDDFKQVNDRFGHDVGDEILKKIVRVFKQKFRTTDYFVRFGGDEFAVVMVNYKKQSNFLRKRMDEINEELMHPSDDLPPVTISVGAVISADGYSKEIYTEADKALYQSKHSGKGTCVVFDDINNGISEEKAEENFVYAESMHYMNDKVKVIVEKKQQLRSALMVKNKPVGFATGFCDEEFTVYSFNGFLPEILGYTKDEFSLVALKGFIAFVHPDDTAFLLSKGKIGVIDVEKIRLLGKDGEYLWFNMDYIITKTTEGQNFWMASLKNIDDSLVGHLCEDDYRMVALIDEKQETMIIEKGAYLVSDRELHIQTKYSYGLLIENAIYETIIESDRAAYLEKSSLENVRRKLSLGGAYEFTVYQKWGDSDYCVVRHKYRYMSDKEKTILCTWEILGFRAEIDELTDTFNENGFYRKVEEIMKQSNSTDKYDVLYFNISGFKAWNSMLGRENADELLRMFARSIIKSALNPMAVSRLFSDHFACLIDRGKCDLNTITELCNSKFEVDGNHVQLQIRCGILNVEDKSESVRSMCDKAKLAKTQITNERAVPYHFFDNELNETYIQHKHVINQVGHALERKEIKVFYQPIVDVKTRQVVSAEALIRWILPGGRTLSPGIFIPALEAQGYIADVDSYAQLTVCTMLKRRLDDGKKVVPISVNVSRMDFLNEDFVGKIKELVASMNDVAKDYMRVEVTESSFTEVGKNGEDLIRGLRDRGIKILMDDFGTGFSTLSGLTSQQFDIIKIDMSFVRGIGKGIGAEAVISNVISMCHALNMKVVAEGVETEEQYQFLYGADCNYIQGYYFYKPMPEEEFEKVLNDIE